MFLPILQIRRGSLRESVGKPTQLVRAELRFEPRYVLSLRIATFPGGPRDSLIEMGVREMLLQIHPAHPPDLHPLIWFFSLSSS